MEHLVNVAIHSVAGLCFSDPGDGTPNPFIEVNAFGEQRFTHVEEESVSASFGNFFSISKNIDEEEFTNGDIEVTVHHRGTLIYPNKVMGKVTFSIAKVYKQPHHTVARNWFPVALPENPGDPMGFVELTLGAYGPGDEVPRGAQDGDGGNEEGNFTLKNRVVQEPSKNGSKSLWQVAIRVHRAEGLRKIIRTLSESCDPFIKVCFNGTEQRTPVVWDSISPTWNAEARVPFIIPHWDDSINIYLISEGTATSSETELGEVTLYVDDLIKEELPPTWYNFYASESAPASIFGGELETHSSLWAGRLLLSAQVERSEKAMLTVTSCASAAEPRVISNVIWVDFYEVCFDCKTQPEDAFATISVDPFLPEQQSNPPERHSHAFVWGGGSGRMQDLPTLKMPDSEQCADVIVSVHAKPEAGWFGEGAPERSMYCRIPAAEIMDRGWDTTPRWQEMLSVKGNGGYVSAGFLLMSLNIGPQADAPKKRPPVEKIRTQEYCFRAKVYQAVNLPTRDTEGCTDPFAVLCFGAGMVRTSLVSQSPHPLWYQVLEANVELPDNEFLRPAISIFVIDQDDDDQIQPLAQLKYKTREVGALPKAWHGAPKWLDLEAYPGGVPTNDCKILVSFELEPGVKAKPPQSITPPSVDCKVEFYAIGVRVQEDVLPVPLRDPLLQVLWSRMEAVQPPPEKKSKHKVFSREGEGANGNYNFLQKLTFSCSLAKDAHYYPEYLEVKLMGEVGEPGSGDLRPVAFAFVDLTEYMPWLKEGKSKKKKTVSDATLPSKGKLQAPAAEKGPRGSTMSSKSTATSMSTVSTASRERADPMIEQELEMYKSVGWDKESIEDSNCRIIEVFSFANITEADEKRCKAIRKKYAQAPADPKSKQPPKAPIPDHWEWAEAAQNFIDNFEWQKRKGQGWIGFDDRPDIDDEFEEKYPHCESALPYATADLIVGNEATGMFLVVGKLKFCCRVLDKHRQKKGGPEVDAENKAWEERISSIEKGMKAARDLVVRAYVLTAEGLIPQSGNSGLTSYVSSSVAPNGGAHHNIKDSLTLREHTLHPQFNKCHPFTQCRLPENSQLTLDLNEIVPDGYITSGGEDIIGSTIIDLEDRWFHPDYRNMIEKDIVPIEARSLFHKSSRFGKGHIRVWVDLMTLKQSQEREIVPLPSTDPVAFQLRFVIWRVTHIPFSESQVPDIYVQGKHELDTGEDLIENTDTHYGADDGIGTFNWRFLYDIMVPCREPRLTLRLYSDATLSADESLGEVTLDFAQDFRAAKAALRSVELPRGQLKMTCPAHPGEIRGILDCEGSLLPADEAADRRVGRGREEPNEDPFCDPDDPHLVAHRGWLGNMQILKDIAALGGNLFAGMKLMMALYVVGGALAFIMSSVIALLLALK